MATAIAPRPSPAATQPVLESGDRLTRAEFHRRYLGRPDIKKAELVDGVGVQEYIVWRTLDGVLDWFRLREGEYALVQPDERGVIESLTFPGLRLHVEKMLAGDLAGVLTELESPPA